MRFKQKVSTLVSEVPLKHGLLASIAVLCVLHCGAQKEGEIVSNTAPYIKRAEILPLNPTRGSRIDLRIDAGDKEGDPISYTVNWILNGKIIGTGLEMYQTAAQKGDRIYAEITPSDGKLTGSTVQTEPVTIINAPPKINYAKVTPDLVTATGTLTIETSAIDPDEDSLRYVCLWTVPGNQTTDSSTTLNLKGLNLRKGDVITAQVYAYDNDTVSQPYALEIEVANSPPVIKEGWDSIPYNPDSIYYTLPIRDPDNDKIYFEIIDAPQGIQIDRTYGIVYGKVQETTAFEVLVRATDTDGAFLDAKFTLKPP